MPKLGEMQPFRTKNETTKKISGISTAEPISFMLSPIYLQRPLLAPDDSLGEALVLSLSRSSFAGYSSYLCSSTLSSSEAFVRYIPLKETIRPMNE